MYDNEFKESDWKKFRKLIPSWQERHIKKLSQEYITILNQNKLPSDNFWELENRIKQDKKSPGVLIEMSRSKMIQNIMIMLKDGIIELDELSDFSDTFKDTINTYLELYKIKL